MRRGDFELSALQWETDIDDTEAAWNDTFVHPDSTHWLLEGSGLAFPGLVVRAGVTDKIDAGAYFYLSSSHEKSSAVNLADEHAVGAQAMVGAVLQISRARLALEHNTARVNSRSIKLGVRL